MRVQYCRGSWALITGASSGIGREFANQLAGAGWNLALVARRRERLEATAAELTGLHPVRVLVLARDLIEPEAVPEIRALLHAEGIQVRLICNCAAFGRWGRFEDSPARVYPEMIGLNAAATVSLCAFFGEDLAPHPTSAVINVSSPAALQPVPYMPVYAATKAFVHSFSQALYGEWKSRGVTVQTLVPGPTATEFDSLAGAYETRLSERDSPIDVVRASLARLERGEPLCVPAKGTWKQTLFAALFPTKLVIDRVGRMFLPPADQHPRVG
ncbi:MAG TPA: SDR family NAD(P)-dependent oxidoreductase [Thermoanaerobaculia bacterium]|nr:SDR family NAD(P)-dependent oxidoreductase [Thermoanaerobaculia bacterium]